MRRLKIRCYTAYVEARGIFNNEVIYTVPEGYRLDLASCTSCGEIFVVDREDPAIGDRPLSAVRDDVSCPGCGSALNEAMEPYPDVFIASDGLLATFQRPSNIPPDADSSVREFWALEPAEWAQ